MDPFGDYAMEHLTESGRNIGERVGALEQDMKVVKFRLDVFDRRHETMPERVSKMEQAMAHQSEQFDDLKDGLVAIDGKVDKLASKLAYVMASGAVFIFILDKAWPFITKGFGV